MPQATTQKPMGHIKVICLPVGEAPYKVRKKWIGLVLPCDPFIGAPQGNTLRGVVSKKTTISFASGVSVPQDKAIEILEKWNRKAAKWFKDNGFPKPGEYFNFAEEEIQILDGVTRQEVVKVEDDDWGNPWR